MLYNSLKSSYNFNSIHQSLIELEKILYKLFFLKVLGETH
jgi:hypothetical protein